jgi:hypothetical protein
MEYTPRVESERIVDVRRARPLVRIPTDVNGQGFMRTLISHDFRLLDSDFDI